MGGCCVYNVTTVIIQHMVGGRLSLDRDLRAGASQAEVVTFARRLPDHQAEVVTGNALQGHGHVPARSRNFWLDQAEVVTFARWFLDHQAEVVAMSRKAVACLQHWVTIGAGTRANR